MSLPYRVTDTQKRVKPQMTIDVTQKSGSLVMTGLLSKMAKSLC